MPRKQLPLDQLVKSIGKSATKNSHKSDDDFYTNLARNVDASLAPELARVYAGYTFDQTDEGAELAVLEQSHANTTKERDDVERQSKLLQQQHDETPRSIRSQVLNGDDQNKRTSFGQSDITDQITVIILMPLILGVWVMGGANVFAVLQASGQPIYLEHPWIAMSLSLIVPAFSACLKFTHHIFINKRAKRYFAQSIYSSTLLMLLGWTIVFSISFQGVGGEFEWPDLEEEASTDVAAILLVWLQLASEIMIGGALSIALTEKVAPYFPNRTEENPAWNSIDVSLKALAATRQNIDKKYETDKKRLTKLRGLRETSVFEQVVKFGDKHD